MFRLSLTICLSCFLFINPASGAKNYSAKKITEVDFLKNLALKANALGPQVIVLDQRNNRIIAACVNSSALAVIDGTTHQVTNIPLPARMPRRFGTSSMTIDSLRGKIYLVGKKQLIVVNPAQQSSQVISLPAEYETVAIDSRTERAFLVGRSAGDLLVVHSAKKLVKKVKWGEPLAPLPWKAATPAPPVRNILCDPVAREIYLIDGAKPQLIVFHADKLKILRQRELPVEAVERWHLAGFDPDNHWIYFALENEKRESKQVIRIDAQGDRDVVIDLPPGSREPQGVSCSIPRQEIYIPYDNHPYLHVAHFQTPGKVDSIKVPKFGMNASVVDEKNNQLIVTNWAAGTLYLIDLITCKLKYIIPQFPVYPHTNHLVFNPVSGDLFIPSGATAVNGTFGASLTVFNVNRNEFSQLPLGWAPVSLAPQPGSDAFYIFNSDRQFARVTPDGQATFHPLPHPYAHDAILSKNKKSVFVAYGPHSSFWPAFYIANPRNGIFKIDSNPLKVKDLITDRLAQHIALDQAGNVWALQNTWGTENPFVSIFPVDTSKWQRLFFPDKVENECVFRLLKKDPELDRMYVGRLGNRTQENGLLYVVDTKSRKVLTSIPLGRTPTDICVQPQTNQIVIPNFDSDSVTFIDRTNFQVTGQAVGKQPLALAGNTKTGEIFVVNHQSKDLTVFGKKKYTIKLPQDARPNNILVDEARNQVYVTAHNLNEFRIYEIHPSKKKVVTLFSQKFPYGEVSFDQANSAFAERAQWADAIFRLTSMTFDKKGRMWVTDYLAGKLWIINR